MAFRAVMKLDGIPGTSEVKSGCIDILSFHWGATNDVKAWEKSPTGTARVVDFSVVKRIDPSSPDLMTFCVNGKPVGSAEITLFQASGDKAPKEFAHYKFKTCF